MDLQACNSGTPASKNWFNPVCGSITSSSSTVAREYSAGPVMTINASSFNLTAAQAVNGLIGDVFVGAASVIMPTATELDDLVEQKQVTFTTTICASAATTPFGVFFGGGNLSYDGQTGYTFPAGLRSITLYYFRTPSSGWLVFY